MKLSIVIKKHKVIVSVLINVVILIIHLLVGKLFFVTNDDRFFADILSGAFCSDYREYIVFSNIIYGYILKFFYLTIPFVSWYVWIPIFLSVISFSALTFIIIDSRSPRSAILSNFLLLPTLTFYHYVWFQWTMNAYLYSVIGIILIVYAIEKRNCNKAIITLGIILGTFGFLIRQDCFISVFPVMICGILIKLITKNINADQRRCLVVATGILLSLCAVSFAINKYIYTQDAGWSNYSKYNKYRSKILDYGGIDYNKYASELEEIGIDKEDVDLFNDWIFADNEKFTTDKLVQIDNIIIRQPDFWKSGEELITIIKTFYFILLCILLIGGEIFFKSVSSENRKYIIIPLLILLAECLFLCIIGRIHLRVTYGMLLMAGGILLQSICTDADLDHKYGKKYEIFLFVVGIIFTSLIIMKDIERKSSRGYVNDSFNTLIYHMNIQKEKIFFLDTGAFVDMYVYGKGAMEVLPEGYCDNVYFMGGWDVPSPRTNDILNRYGIKNPMKELIGENVLICDTKDGIEKKIAYLNKEYGYHIKEEIVYQVDDIRNVYNLNLISVESE